LQILEFLYRKAEYYIEDRIFIYVVTLSFILVLLISIWEVSQIRNYFEKGSFWKNFWKIAEIDSLTYDKFSSEKEYLSFNITYFYCFAVIVSSIMFIFSLLLLKVTGSEVKTYYFINCIMFIIFIFSLVPCSYIWNKLTRNIFLEDFNKKPKSNNIKTNMSYAFVSLLVIGIYFTPFVFSGNIKTEIDENSFAKNNQIPIEIVNTGHNNNLTVNLSNTTVEGNMTILDYTKLYPTETVNEVNYSRYKYLRSCTLDYGMYKIFINTTNLTQGYYELSVSEDPHQGLYFGFVKKRCNSFYLDKT
jgi:hypothetical protein